jgi:peptide/nickel transport system permease protein
MSPDLDTDESLRPKLEELEAKIEELLPYPTGKEGLVRNIQLCLGTDKQGRSIFLRGVYSIKVAIQIGFVTALISVLIGSTLGCAAAYFGGWVDHFVIWLYTTFSSVPGILLLVLVAYIAGGIDVSPLTEWIYDTTNGGIDWRDWTVDRSLLPVYIAFCITFWIGPCRVIRGETLKIKELEYVQAANAAGFGQFYIMFRHILPNASHLMLINFSLLFIGAIKSEVILSFLGLGVKDGPSWGIMIAQSRAEVISGFFWQIGAATVFMFGLVLAFNILSDALQDVFDPKHL